MEESFEIPYINNINSLSKVKLTQEHIKVLSNGLEFELTERSIHTITNISVNDLFFHMNYICACSFSFSFCFVSVSLVLLDHGKLFVRFLSLYTLHSFLFSLDQWTLILTLIFFILLCINFSIVYFIIRDTVIIIYAYMFLVLFEKDDYCSHSLLLDSFILHYWNKTEFTFNKNTKLQSATMKHHCYSAS